MNDPSYEEDTLLLTLPKIKGISYGRTLGQGSFAFVKQGRLKKNPSKVIAIKFIDRGNCHRHNLSDDDILRELMIHKSCNGHPHIIQLYDAGSDQRYLWMIMEIAELGDLFDKIEPDVGVDEEVAHFYFKQLVGALEFIHKMGVAHRDIKPENILIDKNGDLKLADFGLACVFKRNNVRRLAHKACGSPPYMAPDIVNPKGYDPEKIDVWSCGVLLYVLLTGETLWEEPTMTDPDFKYFSENNGVEALTMTYPWSKLSIEAILVLRGLVKIDNEQRSTLSKVRRHPWVNKVNKLANEKGLCQNPRHLVKKLLSNLKVDLSDEGFLRATQQNTQMSQTQFTQREFDNGFKGISNSQPVFEMAEIHQIGTSVASKMKKGDSAKKERTNADSETKNENNDEDFATVEFLNTQKDYSEYGKKLKRRQERKDNELLRYQMISKDPSILQFINDSDKLELMKELENFGNSSGMSSRDSDNPLRKKLKKTDSGSPLSSSSSSTDTSGSVKQKQFETMKQFFDLAQRMTRFFSVLPIESVVPIITDGLQQIGVKTSLKDWNSSGYEDTKEKPAASSSSLQVVTEKQVLKREKQKSNDYNSTNFEYVRIKVHTVDSRRMPIKGIIKISKIANLNLKKIEFVKVKGDPLEWRKFFKKVTLLCRDAVYVDQSLA